VDTTIILSLPDESARGTTTPDTTEREMDPPSSSSQDSTDSEQYDSQCSKNSKFIARSLPDELETVPSGYQLITHLSAP